MSLPIAGEIPSKSASLRRMPMRPQRWTGNTKTRDAHHVHVFVRTRIRSDEAAREERARLAELLLASVSGDPDVDAAWTAEVDRRIASVEAGAPLIAAESALVRVRRALS